MSFTVDGVLSADKTVSLQRRGHPFRRGTSGNPAGRPKGARNRATVLAAALIEGQGEALAQKAVDLALRGDPVALRLCIERLVPKAHERPIQFKLPKMRVAADALAAVTAIAAGVARGELSDSEARTLLMLTDSFRDSLSVVDHEARLAALEQSFAGTRG